MNRKALRGSLLLLLGAVIWGAAFAAQRAGMDHVGPFTFSGVRMLLAGIVMIPASMLSRRKAGPVTAEVQKKQRRGGLICGLLLFFATSLQQIGLVYTSAGKAGFITALYVVLVPVAGWVFLRKQPGKMIWAGVGLAVIALYLLCVPAEGFQIEKGDALLLGCAVCFTGQILCVDYYAPKVSGVKLARDEFLVTGVLSLLIAVFTETITWPGIREALIPLLYAGLMSGAVAYTLQIIGQKYTEATLASILMCMESVFAVLAAAFFLHERLTGRELLGCVIMFTAILLSQGAEALANKKANA
jgi:drug/metabolite transporter (DMT)-like permease